jgi:hypothetical protein
MQVNCIVLTPKKGSDVAVVEEMVVWHTHAEIWRHIHATCTVEVVFSPIVPDYTTKSQWNEYNGMPHERRA